MTARPSSGREAARARWNEADYVELVGGEGVPRQKWDALMRHAKLNSQWLIDHAGETSPPPGSDAYWEQSKERREWVDRQLQADSEFLTGDRFILDGGASTWPLWGRGDQVLWAEGEALVIAGVQGTGKTTLAQQVCLGLIGIPRYQELLDLPVVSERRVLYLAMDRPKQAARSFARMIDKSDREQLREYLSVWQGPPIADLAADPELLLRMCTDANADAVCVDSIKDAAIGLSDDAVGAGWNRARQLVLAEGIDDLELHHLRKAPSNARSAGPVGLDDLYGSTWITSGAGSVILLDGKAGDPIVGFRHLKQPMSPVGPFQILHNDVTGRSTIWHEVDLVALARAKGTISALDAAKAMLDSDKPSAAEKEKARRKLDHMVTTGHLFVFDQGDKATNRPRLWAAQ
jgi:hypothetical protein